MNVYNSFCSMAQTLSIPTTASFTIWAPILFSKTVLYFVFTAERLTFFHLVPIVKFISVVTRPKTLSSSYNCADGKLQSHKQRLAITKREKYVCCNATHEMQENTTQCKTSY